jgi:hypothetical protein
MAPPSTDWQSLLRISPANIDADNEEQEEQNEDLGELYMKVMIISFENI